MELSPTPTGKVIVHLLNNYVAGQYDDSRQSILKLAAVPISINERRTGQIRRAFRVSGNNQEEMIIQRDGKWAEVRLPELGVHQAIIL